METKKLQQGDEALLKELVNLYARVFETRDYSTPPLSHFTALLHNWQQFYIVALEGDTVLGGLTAYILPSSYRLSSEAYLYDIAVTEQRQRAGIGTLLMQALFRECKRMGISEVFVQADNVDHHALAFYRKLGGAEEPYVTHFSYAITD